MQRKLIALLLVFMVMGLVTLPAYAATYTAPISPIALAQASSCQDDTCDDYFALYAVSPDVAGRGTGSANAVAIDVCFFGDTNVTFTSATITSTGSLYTGSYINDNTWSCGPSNGTLGTVTTGTGWKCGVIVSDMLFCKLRIDDNSDARITINGRMDAPYECASDTPTYPVPTHDRFMQSDIYKHTDSTKSGGDSYTSHVSCKDGSTHDVIGSNGVIEGSNIFYNGGTVPNNYFYPANGIRIYDISLWNDDSVAGPITYKIVHTLPSYVTATSCNIDNHGSTWYSPLNPPTCVITGSGHTVTVDFKSSADLLVEFEITGNIGSIPECPSSSTFDKELVTMDFMTRNFDGAWKFSQNHYPFKFKCQA